MKIKRIIKIVFALLFIFSFQITIVTNANTKEVAHKEVTIQKKTKKIIKKDKKEVAALKRLIKKEKEAGVPISNNINDKKVYEWNKNGKLKKLIGLALQIQQEKSYREK